MKRIISRTLALLIAVCLLLFTVPALADDGPYDDVINWDYLQDVSVYINDSQNWPDEDSNIQCFTDSKNHTQHFTYVGNGKLQSWTFPKAVEGRDYELVSQSGNEVVIRYLHPNGIPYVNAVVDFGDLTTEKETKAASDAALQTVQDAQSVATKATDAASAIAESSQTTTAPATQNSVMTPDSTYKKVATAITLLAAVAAITAAGVISKKKRKK